MNYENSVDMPGDASAGVAFIIQNFTQLGFRIENKDSSFCEMSGPGMNSTRQSPLLGVSRLRLESSRNRITLRAELGAAKKMRKFLIYFIGGMFIFMMSLFGFLFRNTPNFKWWIPALPFLPWPFLIPIISSMIEKRTRQALDVVLHNARQSQAR